MKFEVESVKCETSETRGVKGTRHYWRCVSVIAAGF